MAVAYPNTEREQRVPQPRLHALVTTIFAACGMRPADAELLADTLVTADLEGVHSHGVMRVPDYVKKLTVDGVDLRGEPRVVRDAGAALVVDAGNSMGQIGAMFATRAVIAAARRHGVAAAAIRGSNHCGALAYFTRRIAAADMIGICATGALPTMAPWGGADKIVGMNPLSIAIPAGIESPIVFDAAFAASSHGKIRVYAQKGVEIPAGWAYDADGRPTTDPASAIAGLLQPIGGHKGVALALSIGMMSSLLSGAAYGTQLGNMVDGPHAGADGHLLIALQIGAFEAPSTFKRRVDEIVREIHGSRRAPGVERLYVPGELEADTARRYAAEGIPLNDATLAGLREAARTAGVDAAQYLPAFTSA